MRIFQTLSFILSSVLVVNTAHISIERRDVYSPRITSPGSTSVWIAGSKEVVTWDVSDAPPLDQITNQKGKILLGYKEEDGVTQHLDFAHPMASGFDIRDGSHYITVPDVPERGGGYFVVLMGDSGNKSPSFSIIRGSDGVGGFAQPGGPEQQAASTLPRTPSPLANPAGVLGNGAFPKLFPGL